MKKLSLALLIVLLPAAGWFIGSHRTSPPPQTAASAEQKIRFYQDSMHPWIKSDQPGKCTVCGMDLTPIQSGASGFALDDKVVVLNSNQLTVLHVETEEAKARQLIQTLRVAGTLEANENRKTIVAAPAAGRIDDLPVRYAGFEVREGERLATFYSPELTLEKRRFLVRARMSVQRDPTGGLAKPQSDADPYYSELISPQTGTVVERKVYQGQYVADGERLFTIVDLSELWFRFDVYEHQRPWVALGQVVEVSVPSSPGATFPAVITFIEPMINEATRSFKVRAEVKNPLVEIQGHKQRMLALGAYAEGHLRAGITGAITAPRSAILAPGDSAWAYVDLGNGAYEKRRLKLGRQGDHYYEVLAGLDPGDQVVKTGNVLIDAQAQFIGSSQAETAESLPPAVASRVGSADAMPVQIVPAGRTTPTLGVASSTPTNAAALNTPGEAEPKTSAQTPKNKSAAHKTAHATTAPVTPPPHRQTSTMPATWSPGHRGPMTAPTNAPGTGFRSGRMVRSDAMTASFSRMTELRAKESPPGAKEQSPAPAPATAPPTPKPPAAPDALRAALVPAIDPPVQQPPTEKPAPDVAR